MPERRCTLFFITRKGDFSGPDVTLTITTQPNDTYDERNAVIVLTCAGERTTILGGGKLRPYGVVHKKISHQACIFQSICLILQ